MLAIDLGVNPLKRPPRPSKKPPQGLGHRGMPWYDGGMTNNIDPDLTNAIDERVQGRDIEKAFDAFIESVTDIVVDDLEIAFNDDEEGMMETLDYIIEKVMSRFNYKLTIS